MFENHVVAKDFQDELEKHGHSIYYVPTDHRLLLLACFFVVLSYIWFYEITFDCFNIFFSSSVKDEITQFEGLKSFYKALSNKNLLHWVYEESLVRNEFNYKKLFDDTYKRLLAEQALRGLIKSYNVDDILLKGLFTTS